MNNYTLPTYNNLWKNKENSNANCKCTDLAIILGTSSGLTKDENCEYYTSSNYNFKIIICDKFGYPDKTPSNNSNIAIRPSLNNLNELKDLLFYKNNNNLIIKYGEYPQNCVNPELFSYLEKLYSFDELEKTHKKYTFYDKDFLEKIKVNEYILEGNKYIRMIANPFYQIATLSNGKKIRKKDIVWIKVEPIYWIYDSKSKIALSQKALLSGIPFNKKSYDVLYENSFIKKYLSHTFSKDILPCKTKCNQHIKKFNHHC